MSNESPTTQQELTYLTPAQVAGRIGKSAKVVRELCRVGDLVGAVKKQNRWYIPTEAVELWLQQQRINSVNSSLVVHTATSQQSIQNSQNPEQIGPPHVWERFRNNPYVFYPILVFSGVTAIIALIAGITGFGADYQPSVRQYREWFSIREFLPEAKGQTLILIFTFHNTASNNVETHIKIRRRIEEELKRLNEPTVRVEVEPTVLTGDARKQAETIGKHYNASMVIWGEDTGIEVVVNYLNLRTPNSLAAEAKMVERERTQLINPSSYSQFITTDLPNRLTFLALFAIGQAYYFNADYSRAIEVTEAAIASLTSDTHLIGLADAYFALGAFYRDDLNKSLTNYDKAIELNPNHVVAYGNRGAVYKTKGKLERAMQDYDKAIELDPNYAPAYNNRGAAYYDKGELERAMQDLDKAIELDPDDASFYNNRGAVYYDKGELERAMQDYDKAIELDLDDASFYNGRGVVYYDKGELERAMQDFDKAIKLDPSYAPAYTNRGAVYQENGELERAMQDLDKAIELDPNYAPTYSNRGAVYKAKGKLEQAMQDLDKAIELDPNDASAYNNRGAVYKAKGKLEQAMQDYDKAIELDPNDASAYNNRGATYYDKGELERAMQDFDKAIELDPNDASAYHNLCIIYEKLKQPQTAFSYCQKAKGLAGVNP